MKSVSTHVLDIHRGKPAQGVPVTLDKKSGDAFTRVKSATTDADGRVTAHQRIRRQQYS